jgi:hypothetical protein
MFVKQFHEGTHSGRTALKTTLAQHFYVPKLSSISKTICERCNLGTKNNPQQGPRAPPQVQSVGGTPFENMILDFFEIPWARGSFNIMAQLHEQRMAPGAIATQSI